MRTEPVLLMCDRAMRPEHSPEAEPVLLERSGRAVVLRLDDGSTVALDAVELRAALDSLTTAVNRLEAA